MDNTGRIQHTLLPSARRIVFEPTARDGAVAELWLMTEVDRAHLVMLTDCALAPAATAAALLEAIDRLRAVDFAPLTAAVPTRGLYLMYEDYLIATESAAVGGVLQTARSRNDLQATILLMRLREPVSRLLREMLRLLAVMLRRARGAVTMTMPVHTHWQPAMPSTYGHYLAGAARALGRELAAMSAAAAGLDDSPLGAGAVAGTTLPIASAQTAALLGFRRPIANSLDAVASRDVVLRLLAAASTLGVLLSRLAADLLRWTAPELAFLRLPDSVVGSSSAMPQKRNPFLLEHVQGRAAAPLGAFVAAATAMHGTPFTHSIAAGSEATRPALAALSDIADAVCLTRLVVAEAEAQPGAMHACAVAALTTALEMANRIARQHGLDFRSSHRLVGEVIAEMETAGGEMSLARAADLLARRGFAVPVEELQPEAVASAAAFGGGPAAATVERCIEEVRDGGRQAGDRVRVWRRQWAGARAELDRQCARVRNQSLSLCQAVREPA